jgi:hypothetical protein
MRARRARAGSAAVIVFGGLLLAGCPAQVYYTDLLPPPRQLAPRRPEDVEILVVTPPARPHTNIGLYQITEGVDAADSKAMIQRLRTEAAARGCDAILVTSIDNQAPKDAAPNVQASCVVYNQLTVPAPAAPGPPAVTAPPAPVGDTPIGKP